MFFYENHWFGDIDMYATQHRFDFSFGYHLHQAFEFLYVVRGTLTMSVDDTDYNLNGGDGVIVFPNQLHRFSSKSESEIYIIIFSPELVGHFSHRYQKRVPCDNVLRNVTFTHEELFCENIYLQKAALYKIFGILTERSTFRDAQSAQQSTLLHRLLTYVDDNFGGECTLRGAAESAKYDYAYVSKFFIMQMNMSFCEYVSRCRINKACYLLKNTDMKISDIALQCGFETTRSFNRNFTKYVTSTPSGWRRDANVSIFK